MTKLLMTIDLPPSEVASIEKLAASLGLSPSDIDDSYGLILIDPESNAYAFQIEASALNKIKRVPGLQGPFSNPNIQPFD